MSEWLQNLGKSKITAEDISDTNYSEFNRLEHDNVKAVNAANDNFVKGVEAESQALISFYNQMHNRKFNQFMALADIAKTGVAPLTQVAKWESARQEYDKAYENFISPEGPQSDKVLQAYNKGEFQIMEGSNAGQIISESEQAKNNVALEDRYMMRDYFGQYSDLIRNRDEAKTLGGLYYDNYRLSVETMKIPVPDGKGGWKMMSLSEAKLNTKDWNYIDKQLDRLFIMNVTEKGGYDKGFIRKYITYPMMEKAQIRAKNHRVELGKALAVEAEINERKGLYQNITLNRTGKVENSTVISDKIHSLVDASAGKLTFQAARTQVIGMIQTGIEDGSLTKADIKYLGNEDIVLHGSRTEDNPDGVTKKLKDLWPKEYQALYNAARDKNTKNMNDTYRNIEAQKTDVVTTATIAVQEKGILGARQDIEEAKAKWDDKFGAFPYPQDLQNMISALESPIPWPDLKRTLEYHQKWQIPITDDMIARIPTEFRDQWKRIANDILPAGWETQPRAAGLTIAQQTLSRKSFSPTELNNIYNEADRIFIKGYSASMAETRNIQGLDINDRILRAKEAGNLAVETEFKTILEKDTNYFATLGKPSSAAIELRTSTNEFSKAYKANPGIITQEEVLGPWEEPLLVLGEQYLKGELGKSPPPEWQIIARNSGLNAHDLITARLEATGRIPEGIKVDYSNENGKLSQYKTQSGMTYRVLSLAKDGDNTHLEFAEAMDRLQINRDVGGYDHISLNGKVIETAKPASEMTYGDIFEQAFEFENIDGVRRIVGVKEGFNVGMYGLTGKDLLNIHNMLSRNDQAGSFYNRVFDQDLQDELVFLKLRADLDHHKTLNGASSQVWAQTLNISIDLANELQDVYPQLMNTPYLQIKHLLPDVAKALLEELSVSK